MKQKRQSLSAALILTALLLGPALAAAQPVLEWIVLAGTDLTHVVPTSFYYVGQSAPTQMRNSAAARYGQNRYVIASLVDTAGYSADVRASYQGFFITDSTITVQGSDLNAGAYGFGFTNDGKFNLFDVGGHNVLSVAAGKDADLRRPRPLMMQKAGSSVRLYAGRDYVVIAAK
jgi:hypothetical protein